MTTRPRITNGLEITATRGPATALRLAHNLVPAPVGADHGGWLETDYAANGDIVGLTVHANCRDDNDDTNGDAGLEICLPDPNQALAYANRTARLRDRCICAQEQHYVYRWDEANRITEAYRFERNNSNGTGPWTLIVRQRYLYDASNERIVKQTYDTDTVSGLGLPEAVTLYVFPGDFERRGLARNTAGTAYDALLGAETQYVVGGARLTYRHRARGEPPGTDPDDIDRDQRLTIGLTDIIQSTSATLDLLTGELVETSNYYPNGARESYRGSSNGERVAPEPMGFTGKEADEEVGLVYFGQRYLLAHLGRWASPDPLQVHAVGGGEALNGYHYVSGNVLQARDPIGFDDGPTMHAGMKSLLDSVGIAAPVYRSTPLPTFFQNDAVDMLLSVSGAAGQYHEFTGVMYLSTAASISSTRHLLTYFHEFTHHVVETSTDSSVVAAIALVRTDLSSAGHGSPVDLQETIAYYLTNVVNATHLRVTSVNEAYQRYIDGEYDRAQYEEQLELHVVSCAAERQRLRDDLQVVAGGADYRVDLTDSTAAELERAFLGRVVSDDLLSDPMIRLEPSDTRGDPDSPDPDGGDSEVAKP